MSMYRSCEHASVEKHVYRYTQTGVYVRIGTLVYIYIGGKGREEPRSARSCCERCLGARAVSNCSESAALTQSRADRVEPSAAELPWVGTEREDLSGPDLALVVGE